ncbi:peroxisomal membrane protein 4 [Patella vulgata]|uniref:peroxisomal membrane protein 4 n=1 Tax=Patella vulgata TaxID=6465 RepID=UPI002180575E|nr:peroxisomal membrane protein 4 [Patella vulgata]
MAAAIQTINQFLVSGQYHSILALIKGLRNGIVYGAKVRFPHALVMTFLFKSDSFRNKLITILQATYTHSKNLGLFVLSYKTLTTIMQYVQTQKYQPQSFIAAFCAGYLIFGRYNKVNEQINLYLLSRIIYGLAQLAVKKGYIPKPKKDAFPMFAALVWGIVLWLFEHEKDTLQPSLRSSMTYLYTDSNKWHDLKDFIIHNKP